MTKQPVERVPAPPPKQHASAVRYFLQGLSVPVGLLTATVVIAACTQIDAFRKIADYRAMYEDYRNQMLQLKSLSDTELVNHFGSLVGVDINEYRAELDRHASNILAGAYGRDLGDGSNASESALERVGQLHRDASNVNDALSECWRQQYGSASIGGGESQAIIPDSATCRNNAASLNALSLAPGNEEGTVRPNTALETEVSRSLYYDDYPVLTVLRSDLAWLRDNPQAWHPMRFTPDTVTLSIEQIGEESRNQQRIAAILAGRGLSYIGDGRLEEQGERLSWYEDTVAASQALSTLGLIYESFAAYPTNYLNLLPAKQALQDLSPEDIDDAQEGDRRALLGHYESLQSTVDIIKDESDMRFERLLGVWVSQKQEIPEAL